jgi:hypothetical protein
MTRVLPYQLDHPEHHLQRPAEPELSEPVEADPDAEPEDAETAWDEADRLASLSHADFLAELRGAVEQVKEGTLPGGAEDAHPTPKERSWSPRRKRRDRHGRAF